MREVNETVTKTPGLYTRTVIDLNQSDLFSPILCAVKQILTCKFLIPLVDEQVNASVI